MGCVVHTLNSFSNAMHPDPVESTCNCIVTARMVMINRHTSQHCILYAIDCCLQPLQMEPYYL